MINDADNDVHVSVVQNPSAADCDPNNATFWSQYTVHGVPGDGNCFMQLGVVHKVQSLMSLLQSECNENPLTYLSFLENASQDLFNEGMCDYI